MAPSIRAVGYTRVSTGRQIHGESLSTQKHYIQTHCEAKGWQLINIYSDEGISGAKDDRPGLQSLLQAATQRAFDVVIVRDISRYGRSARDILNNVETLSQNDINFISVKEGIDASTTIGRFFLNILASIAELEREMILGRTTENRVARWNEKRIFCGKLPYVYMWNKKAQEIEIIEGELETYNRIVSDYLDLKKSMVTIALELNNDKVPTRNDGKRWHTVVISQILRNPSYWSGELTVNQRKSLEEHITYEVPQLISKTRWDEIQTRVQSSTSRSGRPSKAADAFLLYGMLQCGHCGARLSTHYGSRPRADGTSLRHYVCFWHEVGLKDLAARGKERCPLPRIDAKEIEAFVWSRLIAKLIGKADDAVASIHDREKWNTRIKVVEQKIEHLKSQKKGVETKLANLDKLLRSTDFDPSTYVSMRSDSLSEIKQIDLEKKEAVEELDRINRMQADEEMLATYGKENASAITQVVEMIKTLPYKKKQRLIQGMLAEPIKVGPIPQGLFYPEDIEDDDLSAYTPQPFHWVEFLFPVFRFNPLILQEVLGKENPKLSPPLTGRVHGRRCRPNTDVPEAGGQGGSVEAASGDNRSGPSRPVRRLVRGIGRRDRLSRQQARRTQSNGACRQIGALSAGSQIPPLEARA